MQETVVVYLVTAFRLFSVTGGAGFALQNWSVGGETVRGSSKLPLLLIPVYPLSRQEHPSQMFSNFRLDSV